MEYCSDAVLGSGVEFNARFTATDRACALDAQHFGDAAVAHDVARLRGPGRNRTEARHDEELQVRTNGVLGRTVVKKRIEAALGRLVEIFRCMDKVHEAAGNRLDVRASLPERLQKTIGAEFGKRLGSVEFKNDAVGGRHEDGSL